jgi:hypothetical protein
MQAHRSCYVFWLFSVGWQKLQLAQSITGAMFFHETMNSGCYVRLIPPHFFNQLTDGKMYGHFMQDNVTAQTAKNSIDASNESLANTS